jgi:hypothetical protein
MANIEHWTVEDREALVMVTLGAFDLPDRGELVRRITTSYVPRHQLAGAVKEVETLRAGISWARGMLTDGERPDKIDVFLGSVLDYRGGQ